MAEFLALIETKHLIHFMGYRAEKVHRQLYCDLCRKTEMGYVLSDSYELVQSVAIFLCEHYGKRLSDILYVTKKGKCISVRIHCYRIITRQLTTKSRRAKTDISLENIKEISEPITIKEDELIKNYTVYDKIVECLNLTKNMQTALECRMAGLSYPEIGRILGRVQSTVYEYFIKMRARYTAIYGE